MIVAVDSSGRRRIRSTNSNPSIFGMCISVTISPKASPAFRAATNWVSASSSFYRDWSHLPSFQHPFKDPPVGVVVVHYKYSYSSQDFGRGSAPHLDFLTIRSTHSHREVEVAPSALLALHPDFPSHHSHEPYGDRQSQASAAVLARRRGIRLSKRIENFLPFVFGNSDSGVRDRKSQDEVTSVLSLHLNFHRHFALGRELDCVPD